MQKTNRNRISLTMYNDKHINNVYVNIVTFMRCRICIIYNLLIYLFTESNGSQIELTTADFISWRFYHMLNETPAEVTFLGQRESSIIYFAIDPVNLINVCEIEALGTGFVIF